MITVNSLTKFLLKHIPKGYIPTHIKNILDFSSLTNILGFSGKINNKLEKIDFGYINQYGDRTMMGLKVKISKWLGVSPGSMSLGNGSDELIDIIPRIFINSGDVVVSQSPTFFRVIEGCMKMKAKIFLVKAKEKSEFSLDREFVKRMIVKIQKHKPKLIWICTPCNPTGVTMSLENISRIAFSTKSFVIIDEVYQELFDPENKLSAIQLLKKHNNILVLKSLSKAFGLAGIRVGVMVGHKEIIDIVEKVRLNFNIGVLSQKIAKTALDDLGFVNIGSRFFEKERTWLFPKIKVLKNFVIGAESQINVFILKHKTRDLFQELLRHGILTADFRQANGLEGKGYVRITIKTRKENKILLKVLKEIN